MTVKKPAKSAEPKVEYPNYGIGAQQVFNYLVSLGFSPDLEVVTETVAALQEALTEFEGNYSRALWCVSLATIVVECPSFKPVRELGGRRYFESTYGDYLGALDAKTGFPLYGGRGLIQLSGETQYRVLGEMIGVDLVKEPELALDLVTACRILACYGFWVGLRHHLNPIDLKDLRRAVNGGLNGFSEFESAFNHFYQHSAD